MTRTSQVDTNSGSSGFFPHPQSRNVSPFMQIEESKTETQRRLWKWLWLIATLATAGFEAFRLKRILDAGGSVDLWLLYWNPESTAPLLVLLVLPLFRRIAPRQKAVTADTPAETHSAKMIAGLVFVIAVSLFCSWQIGSREVKVSATRSAEFAGLPFAYHDEYSYSLQASLFRNGRIVAPAAEIRPDLFHQFHVLNERVTASRYFPWPAVWMAVFVKYDWPVIGQWVAGAAALGLFYLALIQVLRWRIALLGCLLMAVSPGPALFSNLMLSHHPVLIGLGLFVAAFFRVMRTDSAGCAVLSAIGLTLAMLGRPMTAAGFGLPFGIWLFVACCGRQRSWKLAAAFGVPLIVGFLILGWHNRQVTGSWGRTAYQEYTDTFTPRHRYGFGNGLEQNVGNGPPAVHRYDEWAENLTLQKAAANVWSRLGGSFRWTWAVVPLAVLVAAGVSCLALAPQLVCGTRENVGIRLLTASILTLHLVHIPYWYDGIQNWHYVFESCVPLLVLAAIGSSWVVTQLTDQQSRLSARVWVSALLLSGLIPCWVRLPMFDDTSKVGAAVSELAFSRVRLHQFREEFGSSRYVKPALVLVDERGTDPQLSYIINSPDLDDDVIVCRRPKTEAEVGELRAAFPDRTIYHFDPAPDHAE